MIRNLWTFHSPWCAEAQNRACWLRRGTHCSLTHLYNWTIREGKVTWTHLPQSNKGFWCIGPYSWHLHPHSILVPQHRRTHAAFYQLTNGELGWVLKIQNCLPGKDDSRITETSGSFQLNGLLAVLCSEIPAQLSDTIIPTSTRHTGLGHSVSII